MNILSKAVLTACSAGMISSIMQALVVGKSGKRMMKLLVNTVVILCIVKPFISTDIDFDFSDMNDLEEQPIYNTLDDDFSKYYLIQAELSVKNEIEEALKHDNIKYSSLSIKCEMDEYHVIAVGNISVVVNNEESRNKVISSIKKLLPDTTVYVTLEETDAQRDQSKSAKIDRQ